LNPGPPSPERDDSRDPQPQDALLVAEVFGPTFQGEGPSAGQQAVFVRLSRCNLSCSWCDTPETWDASRFDLRSWSRRMSGAQVWAEVKARGTGLVVITGGEPLLQQNRLAWLAAMCQATGRRTEIETNGTVAPTAATLGADCRFNVSVKLANSGVPAERRVCAGAIREFVSSGHAVFKFVVTSTADLDEIAQLQCLHGIPQERIWVMPEGTTSSQVIDRMRELADPVLSRGWHLSPRLHTLLWENARGR
jgi:7-carboxy-7-deazaguanine synthase